MRRTIFESEAFFNQGRSPIPVLGVVSGPVGLIYLFRQQTSSSASADFGASHPYLRAPTESEIHAVNEQI